MPLCAAAGCEASRFIRRCIRCYIRRYIRRYTRCYIRCYSRRYTMCYIRRAATSDEKKKKRKKKKVYDELRKAEIGFTSSKGGRGTATSCYAATGVMLLFQTFIKEKKKPEAYGQCITPLGKREGKSYGCFMGRE